MFRRVKNLEKRVEALENFIKEQIKKEQQEKDFTNPRTMGGKR